MRKFRVFTASVLAYLMLISLIPSSLVESIVKASENDYVFTVKNDYYINGSVQYGDEVIVAYQDQILGKLYIASIKNGKETILKELDGYFEAQIYQDNDVAKIKIYGSNPTNSGEISYEKLDLNTKTFKEMSQDEWSFDPKKENSYKLYSDEEIEENLEKISKYTDLKISIKEMTKVEGLPVMYEDENQIITISLNKNSKNGDLVSGAISISKKEDSSTKEYNLAIYNDSVYINDNGSVNANYDSKNQLAIIIEKVENGSKVIEIDSQGNKTIRESEIEGLNFFTENIFKINNKLYIYDKNITVWESNDDKYVLEEEISSGITSFNNNSYDDKYWFLNKENKSLNTIDKLGNVSKVMDLGNSIDKFLEDWENPIITNCKNGDILINVDNQFLVVQKKVDEVIINPDTDTNKPNTDNTTNNNSNNGNNTTNNDQNKAETGKGELPNTGSAVSNNTILVLALGAVLVGGVMFIRKKKVA